MFRNYLIVAVRHLLRQKLYAFINVFGLAVGLACCILIFLYVRHEWQYDAFHENADRIFRVFVQGNQARRQRRIFHATSHDARCIAERGIPGSRAGNRIYSFTVTSIVS